MNQNTEMQYYKSIPIRLVKKSNAKYACRNAKRYTINGTGETVWIPNKHLTDDGTIKKGENIDYVFIKNPRSCRLAGIDFKKIIERYRIHDIKAVDAIRELNAIDAKLKNMEG